MKVDGCGEVSSGLRIGEVGGGGSDGLYAGKTAEMWQKGQLGSDSGEVGDVDRGSPGSKSVGDGTAMDVLGAMVVEGLWIRAKFVEKFN